MGCDIHLYVERRENGKWVSCDQWETDTEDGYKYRKAFYSGRNYNLFAILADVRNGRGFAGVKTGEGFNPISDPKGLPEDVSPEVKGVSDRWDSDGHSHSWLTVAEIMAFDWTQTTGLQGVVSGPVFSEWVRWQRDAGGRPESYCGDVSGGRVKKVTQEEMETLVNAAHPPATLASR